jgi:hypothetical protein
MTQRVVDSALRPRDDRWSFVPYPGFTELVEDFRILHELGCEQFPDTSSRHVPAPPPCPCQATHQP